MKKCVAISDSHGKHDEITKDIDSGDIIFHSGDITNKGTPAQILEFLNWFGRLDFKHKIFIAGNHDFGFQPALSAIPPIYPDIAPEFKEMGITYLMDSMVEIDGLKIYGSPWQPRFYDWAFNLDRGEAIAQKWALIPEGLDVLLTHGPVYGILDDTPNGMRVGCEELYKRIAIVKPKIHICGHIHYARGYKDFNGTSYINASNLDERYEYRNKPISFILDDENDLIDFNID